MQSSGLGTVLTISCILWLATIVPEQCPSSNTVHPDEYQVSVSFFLMLLSVVLKSDMLRVEQRPVLINNSKYNNSGLKIKEQALGTSIFACS